jgi:hypothetical protein
MELNNMETCVAVPGGPIGKRAAVDPTGAAFSGRAAGRRRRFPKKAYGMKTGHPNPIGTRVLIGNLTVSGALLAVGTFALFRWETGGPAFWTASAVFVAGTLAFYCFRRRRGGHHGVSGKTEYRRGPTDDDR